MFYYR